MLFAQSRSNTGLGGTTAEQTTVEQATVENNSLVVLPE